MEKAHALVTVRDIHLVCQHSKTSAQIEGRATRRKIKQAIPVLTEERGTNGKEG